MTSLVRVLLVDDHAVVREGYRRLLERDARIQVVGEAGNQQTPNLPPSRGSRVIAYRLGSVPTIVNDATGQVALADASKSSGSS